MPKSSNKRICVIHKNKTAMVSKITTAVSDSNMNIENMVNASKKEIAYTMLDVTGDVSDSIITSLEAVDGIIKVRVI